MRHRSLFFAGKRTGGFHFNFTSGRRTAKWFSFRIRDFIESSSESRSTVLSCRRWLKVSKDGDVTAGKSTRVLSNVCSDGVSEMVIWLLRRFDGRLPVDVPACDSTDEATLNSDAAA